jgi:outer membrane protein OmpA-like peptidoglycan-associated protein
MGRPVPVHFTEGSRAIQNAINVEFNQLWRILRKNAALRVTIASNTADGSLGKARADAVASYLRVIGIDRARISFAHTGADAVTVTMQ